MVAFSEFTIYLPDSGHDERATPCPMFCGITPMYLQLHQLLRKSTGTMQQFTHTLPRRGLTSLHLKWVGVAHTAGVAQWVRRGETQAASVLLNGFEDRADQTAVRRFLDLNQLSVSHSVWGKMWESRRQPLMTTLHYSVKGPRDAAIAGASTALAAAYFGMFGTAGE